MNVTIAHARAVGGWDIEVDVSTEQSETISHVVVKINGSTVADDTLSRPTKSWQNTLLQKGVYPGENAVIVTVTDGNGDSTDWKSQWS